MPLIGQFAISIVVLLGQATTPPAYVREGDRVIAEFHAYCERLDKFHSTLHSSIEADIPVLLPELPDAPPAPVVFGYQLLPHIVGDSGTVQKPGVPFSYSWPITRGYIDGERAKLDVAEGEMRQASQATGVAKTALILSLINSYKSLLDGQRILDQYIEYNRMWQRAIAEDRPRFDEMTQLLKITQTADPETSKAIRGMLDQPRIPSFIRVVTDKENHRTVLHVPIYTDIVNDGFLAQAKAVIENVWQAKDEDMSYSIEVEITKIPPGDLYEGAAVPQPGDHIDPRTHTARFPVGLILTTGAEATNSVVKRYMVLGPGDISMRAFAHEFGHLLGFSDGYIRGYKDLGEQGFEILELTPDTDDIMSAPRSGAVKPEHFKRIIAAVDSIKDSMKESMQESTQPAAEPAKQP